MKITKSIDLAPLRERAKAGVNTRIEAEAVKATRLPLIYNMKLALARENPDHPLLVDEAKARGITTKELAALILERADAAKVAIITLETKRRALHKQIEIATSEQTLAVLF